MKKINGKLAFVAGIGIGLVATVQAAVTLGTFGFTKVEIPPAGGFNLAGFNYTSNQSLFLEDVFGTNQLVQTAGFPGDASKVYVWDGSTYNSYMQKTDGLFYSAVAPYGRSTIELVSGVSVFIQSPAGVSVTNVVTLSGTVLETASEIQSLNQGFVTLANPYPYDLELNNSAHVDWSNATSDTSPGLDADHIHIWNPNKAGGAGYDSFFLHTDGSWHDATAPYEPASPVLPIGGGAFYDAKNTVSSEVFRSFSL